MPWNPKRCVTGSQRGATILPTLDTIHRDSAATPGFAVPKPHQHYSYIPSRWICPVWRWGSYPQIDNSYPLLRDDELIDFYLERKLNHDIPGKHWEVINAASSGYRIHQQLALIESVILRYQPDLVFTMDGYNDAIAVFNHLRQGDIADFDVYATTPDGDDFDALANPGSLKSLYVFTR